MQVGASAIVSDRGFLLKGSVRMSVKKKVCIKCGDKKLIEEFTRDKSRKDGRNPYCKGCVRRYAQSSKGKEAHRRAMARYAKTEGRKRGRRRYFQSSRGKQASRRHKITRRAKKTHAGGTYTQSQWYKLCEFYGFRCLKCDRKMSFEDIQFDHIKPIAKGGTSFITNGQPLCGKCNKQKGNREIDYRKSLPDWLDRSNDVWLQNRLL